MLHTSIILGFIKELPEIFRVNQVISLYSIRFNITISIIKIRRSDDRFIFIMGVITHGNMVFILKRSSSRYPLMFLFRGCTALGASQYHGATGNDLWMWYYTVYPTKYAHGFVVLCFVVVMQSFIMNAHKVFIHIHQGCFAGTGAIVRLPQCQWSKPDGYGKISQGITTTKHSKAKTVCIFLGIYCR